jgi:hypothetical protein
MFGATEGGCGETVFPLTPRWGLATLRQETVQGKSREEFECLVSEPPVRLSRFRTETLQPR